jgi:hypothetical protein
MNPEWAPTAAPSVSKGFNAWMDTLPFGDNYHKHMKERRDKQRWVENERLNNPHFLLRRVEANNAYLKTRADFLDKLVQAFPSLRCCICACRSLPLSLSLSPSLCLSPPRSLSLYPCACKTLTNTRTHTCTCIPGRTPKNRRTQPGAT